MPKRFLACKCAWVRVTDSTQTSTSMGSSETDAKALAVMPCTSPSRSTVMMVTPVAKQPMALRKSEEFKVMLVETWLRTSLSPGFGMSSPDAGSYVLSTHRRNRLHYHGGALYHSRQGGCHAYYAMRSRSPIGNARRNPPRAGDLTPGCAAPDSVFR